MATKFKRTIQNKDLQMKEVVAMNNDLCNNPIYIDKFGDPALVPVQPGTISGLSSGRIDIMNIATKTIVKLCNSLNCTPNDVIPNPLSAKGDW